MVILTEKESVAINYARALGLEKVAKGKYINKDGSVILTYAAGHLYKLYEPEDYDKKYQKWDKKTLPIIPTTYRYKPDKSKSEIRKTCESILKEAIRKKDEIVIATDPDREGEVIARLILDAIHAPKNLLTRVWACEGLNDKEILKGIENRKSDNCYDLLAFQGIFQKQSDWVLGINLTRCYTLLNNKLFSVGRVQTAVLKELYKRQNLITNFVPQNYYKCIVTLDNGEQCYILNPNTNTQAFESYEEASKVIENVKNCNAEFLREETKEKTEKPPKLYDLAGLQTDCYKYYTMSVDETLNYAQKLYNIRGVLSYPRTDSVCLAEEDEKYTKELYESLVRECNIFQNADASRININNKRLFDSKGVTGHHGIIPSGFYKEDGSNEWKVWDLVFRRFLMAGMSDYVYKLKDVFYTIGEYYAILKTSEVINEGWKEALLIKDKRETSFTNYRKGDVLKIKKAFISEEQTKSLPYYNEGTLITFMRNPGNSEEEGVKLSSIGTQATQAGIIKTLFTRGYITTRKKHIEVTADGMKIVEQIKENKILDSNTSVESTTRWEKVNKENPKLLLSQIEEVTRQSIKEMQNKMFENQTYGKCPKCGGNLIKNSRFFYCENWKTGCKFQIARTVMGKEITDELFKKIIEKHTSGVLQGISKTGNRFKFEIKLDEDEIKFNYDFIEDAVCKCPMCKTGDIYERDKVYKCSNKDCKLYIYKNIGNEKLTKNMVIDLCNGNNVLIGGKKMHMTSEGHIMQVND